MFSQQTVFHTEDFKVELFNYEEEHILKCGEVFRASNGNLSITCVHCDLMEFASFSEFALHVDKHYNLLLQETVIPPPSNDFANKSNTIEFIDTYMPRDDGEDEEPGGEEKPTSTESPKATIDTSIDTVTEEFTQNKCSQQKMVQNKRDLLSHVTKRRRPKQQNRPRICHSCDYCDEKFSLKVALVDHMMNIHHRGLGCEYCGKQFKRNRNLIEHVRSHTGEKPVACPMCPARFATASSMAVHIRYHKGEKPFLCAECGKRFTVRAKLRQHVQMQHSDDAFLLRERHPCTLCDRKFMHSRMLRNHMLTHNNERKIVCDICSKTFTIRKHIVQHMQLHSGIKSYTCRYCKATFAQAAGRRNHEKYNHESTLAV